MGSISGFSKAKQAIFRSHSMSVSLGRAMPLEREEVNDAQLSIKCVWKKITVMQMAVAVLTTGP